MTKLSPTYALKNLLRDDDEKYCKVRDHSHNIDKYRGPVHNMFKLRYKTIKGIPVGLLTGLNYGYHSRREFKEKFECLEQYTEKYITYTEAIQK